MRPRRCTLRLLAAGCASVLGAAALVWVGAPAASAQTRGQVVSAAAHYGTSHGYRIGVAVFDTVTGHAYVGGSYASTFASESIVKTMIATRLLVQGRMHGTTAARAYKMITQSDDAIASSFYGSVGGDSLINWVKRRYRVPNLGSPPHRAGWWGNTHITALGLVEFYAKVKRDPKVGPWLLNAMHHARKYGSDGTYQFFGLPSATTGAAIKQGWGDDYDDWGRSADFNTTGFVNGNRYAVAILARGPIRDYGGPISAMLTRAARLLLPGGVFPDPVPTVTGLSMTVGRIAGGQRVYIHGANFTHVTAVTFGGYRGTAVRVFSPWTIGVTTPRHPAGPAWVGVVTTHGTSVGSRFSFVAPPVVGSISPHSSGPGGGTVVTVHGHGFISGTVVRFGTYASKSVRIASSTSLTAVAPAHPSGPVDVQVSNAYGTSAAVAADRFTYRPEVTSISPTSGPVSGGNSVTVHGHGFVTGTTVQFGSTTATSVHIASSTSLTAVAPAHASGPVDVRVTNAYGTSAVVSADVYTYAPPTTRHRARAHHRAARSR